MSELPAQIERFLLDRGTWVRAREIVDRFGLPDDRCLRARGRKPGLLAGFAFSHPAHGIIHHRHLNQRDFLRLDNALGRHGISELRARKLRRLARRRCLDSPQFPTTETHSGQLVFL
jgi:hypothetical protein